MSAGRAVGWLVLGGLVSFVASETARLLIEPLNFGYLGTMLITVTTTLIVGAFEMVKAKPAPASPYPPRRYPRDPYDRRPRPTPSGGGWGTTAAAVILTVAALGAAAFGGSWLFRYVTGTQSGVERMADPPAQGTAGPLTIVMRGVEVTPDFMKFRLRATNTGDIPITIAVNDQWCRLVDGDGRSLSPYGGLSGLGSGNIEVPSGNVPVEEVLTFKGQPTSTTFTLSFSALFMMGPGPSSIQVPGIRLTEA
jgi:hypothetical protein